MLENVKEAITDGDDVLSFPLNMYFNVCLCFLVGEKGSVTCFGHTANWTWLEKAGLRWLDTDDRLMFINDENTSLPIPYADFIEEGFEIRQPYDTLILADNSLPRVPLHVRSQLKPNAICFQPSSNTYFNLEEAPPIIPQPAPLVYH
ncbi:hypothetical protein HDE_05313 [Halotydeus destructor]|nr:hypothetical protein HDE_05313 [Halotydeus destructor]